MGMVQPGSAFVSLGTSGVLFAVNDAYKPNADSAVHTFCHALPDTWHQMGVILSAAGSLDWLTTILGANAATLSEEAENVGDAPSTVRFAPYLSGERTPHSDAEIRGGFSNLGVEHTRGHMARAVMEGVVFAFRDNLEALRLAGTELDRVTAVGGGSRSTFWLQLLADTLKLPVDVPQDGDFGGAFGAARLGRLGTGAHVSDLSAPPTKQTIEPRSSHMQPYEEAYQTWLKLYPALKEIRI
jgi:xylulokinase